MCRKNKSRSQRLALGRVTQEFTQPNPTHLGLGRMGKKIFWVAGFRVLKKMNGLGTHWGG